MSRIITIFLLVLASFCVNAGATPDGFDQLNSKLDCLLAASTRAQQALCVDGTSQKATPSVVKNRGIAKGRKLAEAKYVSSQEFTGHAHTSEPIAVDKRLRDSNGVYHLTKDRIGRAPVKKLFASFAKQPHARDLSCKKVSHDMFAMGVTSTDYAKYFHVICDEVLSNLDEVAGQKKGIANYHSLLTAQQAQEHAREWKEMFDKGERRPGWIGFGDRLQYMSFNNGIIRDLVIDFHENLPAYAFPLENGKELLWIPFCGNFALRGITSPPLIPQERPPVKEPPPTAKPPSLSPNTEENVALVKTTIGGWTGIHTNSGWNGHYEGGKATVTLPLHNALGLEDEQIWVGVGARGEEWHGRSKLSQYMGNGSRMVPIMLVVDWNGRGGIVGDTHAGSLNVGVGGNWMHGHNSATGYFKDQFGKEVHVRLEGCERKGKWVTCLYAEGNGAFGKIKMHSSWSGDTPNKTSSVMVGGSVEYLIDDHWSVKGVLEGSLSDNNPHAKLAITAALEACYRAKWEGGDDFAVACAGPYVRLGEYDGYTFGGTANLFAGKIWTKRVAAQKSNAVSFPQYASPFIQSSLINGGGKGEMMQVVPKQ